MLWVLLGWFLIVTFVGYVLMAEDKAAARNRRKRISEKAILLTALLGGFIGVYAGMQHCRHKTKKIAFQLQLYGIFLLYLAVFVLWLLGII
jgi:uncharacterized membrane protein YsdA (DUF1294 family)